MTLIRFKTRSLIRRLGTEPVEVSEALAKQYIDRGQAIKVKVATVKDEKTGEVKEEIVGDLEEEETPDSQEESPPSEEETAPETEEATQDQDEEEEKLEVKITKRKKK
jgi:hypothetical protein